ncbi:MAG: hypothetical protein EOM17_07315 [Synergistales bacterium]|nr:hypothetical protein [Synergistales bacterium]
MLKVFNSKAITKKQRFIRALFAGLIVSIALAIATAYVSVSLRVQVSIIYLGIGYLIATVIRKQGRGVQLTFSILGASLTFLTILIADMLIVTNFNLLGQFTNAFLFVIRTWLSTNINGLIGLGFRIAGIYYAYINSRIV